MENLNSYFGMGKNDYLYAKAGMSVGESIGNFNGVAALCSQSCEKYLKAVIELCFTEHSDFLSLLHSHNLRTLFNVVIQKYNLSVTSKDCKWVGDFYFDARYPGDNFVTVNQEDAKECLRITELLEKDVWRILQEEKEKRKEIRNALDKARAF